MKRGGARVAAAMAFGLVLGSSVASAQTIATGAQCQDGDPAAVGTPCTTSDGGGGACLAEMCEVVDEGGTSLGPCALCYGPGDAPPGDGGAIVVISTTTTTSSDAGGACATTSGARADGGATLAVAFALAGLLAARRRHRPRGAPPSARRDRKDGGQR